MTAIGSREGSPRFGWDREPNPALLNWCIWIGAAGFISVLALSAVFDPTIRVLHAFQALMYVAVIWLTAYGSRWGLFLGVACAAFWNYMAMFVNSFFAAGVRELSKSIATGTVQHPDLIIAVFAVSFHALMIVGCAAAWLRLRRKSWTDVGGLSVALVGQAAYFAAILALFQPRYLAQFGHLLHPHPL
jgi:hypothetical protein